MNLLGNRKLAFTLALLVLFAVVPPIMVWLDEPFQIDLFARIMIFAIAAISLDLLIGYGGMVSFGHAAYIGIGAYAVGIWGYYGVYDGVLQFVTAAVVSGLAALIIGAISLRTSGVYFIMITLAFSQMLFFLGISLEQFGGDDGLPADRSEFYGVIDLYDGVQFYYFVFAFLVAALYFSHRLVRSRFGRVLRGAKSNADRMEAIGYPVYRYRLVGFVLAGVMCGLAGALFANWNEFSSPEYMHWTRSGEIMIMVILGGMASLAGPIAGATAFLLLEEYLPPLMNLIAPDAGLHWQVVLGPLLIAVVLFARGGLFGLLTRRDKDE